MKNLRYGMKRIAPTEASRDALLRKDSKGGCDWAVQGEISEAVNPAEAKTRKYGEAPKSRRDTVKEELDNLKISYRGNASNDTLEDLLTAAIEEYEAE